MSQYARNLESHLVGALHPEESVDFIGEYYADDADEVWLQFKYRDMVAWACINENGEVEIEDDLSSIRT